MRAGPHRPGYDCPPAYPNPAGGGTSTERLKTGAEQVLAVSHILGAPSFSLHRSGAFIRALAQSPFRRFAHSLFCGCVSGW